VQKNSQKYKVIFEPLPKGKKFIHLIEKSGENIDEIISLQNMIFLKKVDIKSSIKHI